MTVSAADSKVYYAMRGNALLVLLLVWRSVIRQ